MAMRSDPSQFHASQPTADLACPRPPADICKLARESLLFIHTFVLALVLFS